MFTGIIENFVIVKNLQKEKNNLHITLKSILASELKINQSIAHNGACLTVVEIGKNEYVVTAIEETINKTNFKFLKIGDKINIERAMLQNQRIDGHWVQGHIDQTAECTSIKNSNGSWIFSFKYDSKLKNITIEKGSITINGVSLTVINSQKDTFSVAIIPYTYENTNFHQLKVGGIVNLEFDIIGKYITKMYSMGYK